MATPEDVETIACMHMACLPPEICDFTLLGRSLVERFYFNTITRSLGVVILAVDAGDIVGFTLVTTDAHALFNKGLLSNPKDWFVFLTHANPLGLLKATWIKLRSHKLRVRAVPCLVYLAVKEEFRGRGYGTELANAAEAWFREKGVGYYELDVHDKNRAALNLYLRKGMQITNSYVKNGLLMHTLHKTLGHQTRLHNCP